MKTIFQKYVYEGYGTQHRKAIGTKRVRDKESKVRRFFQPCAGKCGPALDGLDRWNGAKCGLFFVNGYGIISAGID